MAESILGISAYYHDSAAALLVNGRLVAAVQEERFSRIKHDASFPRQPEGRWTIWSWATFFFQKMNRPYTHYLPREPKEMIRLNISLKS